MPRWLAQYYIQVFLIVFFLLSSDIFITLRYAVPTRAKFNQLI